MTTTATDDVIFDTDKLLLSLCQSVARVLNAASGSGITYSGMVQRIHKTCLKPDIGCFVLFDGGFSGLVILNFSGQAAMELYRGAMQQMGLPEHELATSYTSDEVANMMGELLNQALGDFTSKIRRELQTHISHSQPKMVVLNRQVMLSVDAHLDQPEARRVTFYTARNHIFYLELAIDRTEFVRLTDFEPQAAPDPDALMAQGSASPTPTPSSATAPSGNGDDDTAELLRSLGM
ncbi:DUF3334 family protein [Tepidimonas sp.]|uniref:DUF3334 family protein n=1 Tax=Tepidimonas sp. TaxID=2002775 RepID=UPI002FDF3CD6